MIDDKGIVACGSLPQNLSSLRLVRQPAEMKRNEAERSAAISRLWLIYPLSQRATGHILPGEGYCFIHAIWDFLNNRIIHS